MSWQPIETMPEGETHLTRIFDEEHGERNVTRLKKKTRIPGETRPMFFTPDGGMYMYYTPTHWQPTT